MLFFFLCPTLVRAAIGTWKAYMAYYEPSEIEEAGDILYVLASDNLYAYDRSDQSIQTYDKVNFLNDCNIKHISWNQSAKKLLIAYTDGNFDLLDKNNNVEVIPDLYNKSMTEDKTINNLYVNGKYTYVSTGFGILKINMSDAEISETYNLGFNVNHCYIEDNYIYACSSSQGNYRALLTDNLIDKSSWSKYGNYTGFSKNMDEELLALVKTLNPGGPKYNHFVQIKFHNGKLYTVGGLYEVGGAEKNYSGTVQVLNNDDWTIYQDSLNKITGYKFVDNMSIAVDPNDDNHVFVGGRTGMYEFNDGKFTKAYNQENSKIQGFWTGNGTLGNEYTMVTGLEFDNSGNLWVLNGSTYKSGLLKYSNNNWTVYAKSGLLDKNVSCNSLSNPIIDSRNILWFTSTYWSTPRLFCYSINGDSLITYSSFVNEDGTNVGPEHVRCVTEDLDGNIWVGTNQGPIYLPKEQILTSDKTFTQVKVPRNDGSGYADYLLSGVDITSIAIDAAGRKWFGTQGNGVYLISADNMTQEQHFVADETQLLSDNIYSMAIDNNSGEVFFATEQGLCSYMSDATVTNTEMTKDNVWAYPNPVTPDFTGLITIVGLTYNADVKILSGNGMLVAQGTSNGGTFTWDGKDLNGKDVASGVYMVNTATKDGKKGTVCKIAIVR